VDAAAAALGYVGSSPEVRTQALKGVSPVMHRPEGHRGHRCCVDPSRKGGARFSLIGARTAGRWERPSAAVVLPAKCKSYGCPCCATRNIRRNRKRAALGTVEGSGIVAMLTGTLDPKHPRYQAMLDTKALRIAGRVTKTRTLASGVESAASVRFIGRAWSNFATAARRIEPRWVCDCRRVVQRGGETRPARRHERGCTVRYRPLEDMAFFKGMELQKNGRAHVHVLLRVDDLGELLAMEMQLRALAVRFGFGGARSWRDAKGRRRFGFEIERARSAVDVASYVAKTAGSWYALPSIAGEVAKAGQQRTLPAYTRRASWSMGRRAWTTRWEDASRGDLTWSFARWDPETLTSALEASGVMVGRHLFPSASTGVQLWQAQTQTA
jgi:hypothetical protein